jgi:hypothetical protein
MTPSEQSDRREPPDVADPLAILRGRGPVTSRLEAITLVRSRRNTEVEAVLRTIALDSADDGIVRAAAVTQLAEWGESVILERQPPPAVQMARKKAEEIIQTRRLVSAFERSEKTARLPEARTLARPSTGSVIQIAAPDPSVQARIVAATSPKPGSDSTAFHVLLLRCGSNELALVADLARLNAAALYNAPARLARLAVHHTDEHDVWTAPFEILTEPAGDLIRIAIIDPRGRVRFAGTGRSAGEEGIAFTLNAADAPGASPAVVEGRIGNRTVMITAGMCGSGGPAPRIPDRVRGPA